MEPNVQEAKKISLLDPYNDAVLISLPYYEPITVENLLSERDPNAPKILDKRDREHLKPATKRLDDFFSPHNLLNGDHKPDESDKSDAKPVEATKSIERQQEIVVGSPAKPAASSEPPSTKSSLTESLPPLTKPLDQETWARLHGQLLISASLDAAARRDLKSQPRNLVVFTPDHDGHEELDRFVEDAADLANADIIRIDASDIAELAGDYIDPVEVGPGSIASLGYDTYEGGRASTTLEVSATQEVADQGASQDGSDEFEFSQTSPQPSDAVRSKIDLIKDLKEGRKRIDQVLNGHHIVGVSFGIGLQNLMQQQAMSRAESKPEPAEAVVDLDRWQRLKLKVFFEDLVSAATNKRNSRPEELENVKDSFVRQKFPHIRTAMKHPDRRRELLDASEDVMNKLTARYGRKRLAKDSLRLHLAHHVEKTFGHDRPAATLIQGHSFRPTVPTSGTTAHMSGPQGPTSGGTFSDTMVKSHVQSKGTIIHVRDIHLIYETAHGEDIVKILTNVVRQRQKDGHAVMIIGTSAQFNGDVSTPLEDMEDDLDKEQGFLRINYNTKTGRRSMYPGANVPMRASTAAQGFLTPVYPIEPGNRRLLELNLRNIQALVTVLGIEVDTDIFGEMTRGYLYAPGTQLLGNSALTPSDVQRIVLTADGFRSLYTTDSALKLPHIAIAVSLIDALEKSGEVMPLTDVPHEPAQAPPSRTGSDRAGENKRKHTKEQRKINLDELRRFASKHEVRLFSGIADPASIKTTYNDVHVAPETIDALKTVTTLSLMRPDAFSYGVLANDRLPGLLLYGPPGTGKTLLAKAVAKDASATVLEVSGAQVYEKYVGEGEKMVKAVFSLAKRLSPCVVFIDEADALFGSRGQNSNRTTHREIINQFLREWDGMDDHSVLMMVATNRPFDLDDAVLRRLPRKILVDLPTSKDREGVLKIHLKGETLAADVSIPALAEQTPFYSGSDLKNVCVAAALAAVKEENELQIKHKDDKTFELPPRRTMSKGHFDKALLEISASISEDMSSLNAIKKFDERYGDRRGRRKKQGYGFGAADGRVDESAARVRGDGGHPGS